MSLKAKKAGRSDPCQATSYVLSLLDTLGKIRGSIRTRGGPPYEGRPRSHRAKFHRGDVLVGAALTGTRSCTILVTKPDIVWVGAIVVGVTSVSRRK